MPVIKKGEAKKPVLPKETVEGLDESLGGDAIVRGLLLTERLAIEGQMAREYLATLAAKQARGELVGADLPVEIGDDELLQHVPRFLAMTVIDGDGEPIFTEQEWQHFGAVHADDAMRLFNVALRLSGYRAKDNAKN